VFNPQGLIMFHNVGRLFVISFCSIIFTCSSLCVAQDKSIDRVYIGPSFGYASYFHTIEKSARTYDLSGNYAKYRNILNYLMGGIFGFDLSKRIAAFLDIVAIRCKKEYRSTYSNWAQDWRQIENKFGDVFYISIFVRYKFKQWDRSSLYCFAGPVGFTDDTKEKPSYLFDLGILAGVGYGLNICDCLSINIEGSYLGIFNRPSSINFQIRPEFRL
jgi:hypothetical protein